MPRRFGAGRATDEEKGPAGRPYGNQVVAAMGCDSRHQDLYRPGAGPIGPSALARRSSSASTAAAVTRKTVVAALRLTPGTRLR